MGGLSRPERAKKCLQCGSEDHRQRDCPTSRPTKPPRASTDMAAKDSSPSASSTSGPRVQKVTFEETTTSEDAATVKGDPVWTMEALLKAAAQVIQTSAPDPEPKAPSMKVMRLGRKEDEYLDAEDVYALMDSGATHPLRRAWTQEEWERAEPTVVTLAGGESVELRMNEGGTLLVPISGEGYQAPTAPIVPLGSLVQQLGYTLEWSAKKCRLVGNQGDVHHLRVRNGCPEITECQALNLIARLENEKLGLLKQNTTETRERVRCTWREAGLITSSSTVVAREQQMHYRQLEKHNSFRMCHWEQSRDWWKDIPSVMVGKHSEGYITSIVAQGGGCTNRINGLCTCLRERSPGKNISTWSGTATWSWSWIWNGEHPMISLTLLCGELWNGLRELEKLLESLVVRPADPTRCSATRSLDQILFAQMLIPMEVGRGNQRLRRSLR